MADELPNPSNEISQPKSSSFISRLRSRTSLFGSIKVPEKQKPNQTEVKINPFTSQSHSPTESIVPVKSPETPSQELSLNNEKELLQKIIDSIPENPTVLEVIQELTTEKECFASYSERSYQGREVRNGEAILIQLPPDKHQKLLDSLTLRHRKDDRYSSSIDARGWDSEGAYTRVLVHDLNTNQWISWPDPYKGGYGYGRGDKFAEPRPASNPEAEVLYDWLAKYGKINPDFVVVIGQGKGKNGITNFHGVDLDFFPERVAGGPEYIFSPGTQFIDPEKGLMEPHYGGGMSYKGKYPGSVPINQYRIDSLEFPIKTRGEHFNLDEAGRLHIPIAEVTDLSRLEVAIGDTEYLGDGADARNKDGHYGRLGWAKLDAFIVRGGRTVEQIMDYINIPPNGVLKGSPIKKLTLQPGDEVVISARNDAAYVMGVRIQ